MDWVETFKHNPIEPLLNSRNKAIQYLTKQDLMNKHEEPVMSLWNLPEPQKLLKNQEPDGSWKYPGKYPKKYPDVNYNLLETYKHLRILTGKYKLNKTHPAIQKAAEYIFSYQTEEGDIRGIYASQYHPHYDALILEHLIKAGFTNDFSLNRCMEWMLSIQNNDGGWAHPLLTEGLSWDEVSRLSSHSAEIIPFNKRSISCNLITGMTLRAFACHPEYRRHKEAYNAGELLASRFFKPNVYNTYRAADNWVRFQYPFWWNNLLMGLDSLSLLGFSREHPRVAEGLRWFIENQCNDGLWDSSYKRNVKRIDTEKAREDRQWITYAVCNVFKRFYEKPNYNR